MKVLATLKLQTKVALQPVPFRGPNCNFPDEYLSSVSSGGQRDETLKCYYCGLGLTDPDNRISFKGRPTCDCGSILNALSPISKTEQSLYSKKDSLAFEIIESPKACSGWIFAIRGFLPGDERTIRPKRSTRCQHNRRPVYDATGLVVRALIFTHHQTSLPFCFTTASPGPTPPSPASLMGSFASAIGL